MTWQAFELPPEGSPLDARIGPLWLRAASAGSEVLIDLVEDADALSDTVEVPTRETPPAPTRSVRLASRTRTGLVALSPMLADRDVVARTDRPLTLAPRTTVRAYVTSPLWLRIEVDGAALEHPLSRPSDTWFGSPTEGALCYASRTSLATDTSELRRWLTRAITPVDLVNPTGAPIVIHRLRLPLPELALWRDPTPPLWWTDTLTLEMGPTDKAEIRRSAGPPRERPTCTQVEPARRQTASRSLLHALNALFV